MTSIDFLALMKAEKQKYKRNQNESPNVVPVGILPPPAPVAPDVMVVDSGDDMLCSAPMRTVTLRNLLEDPEVYHLKTFNRSSLEVPTSLYYIPDFIAAEDEEWLLSQIYSRASFSHWVKLQTRRLQCYRDDGRSTLSPAHQNASPCAEGEDRTACSVGGSDGTSSGGGGSGGGPAGETPFPTYLSHFIDAINASSLVAEVLSKCMAEAEAEAEAVEAGRMPDWGLLSRALGQREGGGGRHAGPDADQTAGVDMNHVLVNEYQPGQGIMHHTDGPRYTPFVLIVSLESSVLMSFKRRLHSHEIGSAGTGADMPVFCVLLEPRSAFIFSNEAYSCFLHGIDDNLHDVFDDHVLGCCINKHLCKGLPVAGGNSGATIPRRTRISLTIRHAL
jgi:hypothetical protein